MRSLVFVFVLFLLPCTALAQQATDDASIEEARLHYEQGALAFRTSRWLDCAQHFERSFTLVFAPELLYNIGLCYQRAYDTTHDVDNLHRGVAAFRRYLRELPNSDDRVDVQTRIGTMTSLLESLAPPPETQPEPEPEPEVAPEPEPEVVPDPEPPVEEIPPPPPQGFQFVWTTSFGVATILSLVTTISLGAVADAQYHQLASGCGLTPSGCTPGEISNVDSLSLATNVMIGVTSALAVAAGVSFAFEFGGL
jgi:hypothetical protein